MIHIIYYDANKSKNKKMDYNRCDYFIVCCDIFNGWMFSRRTLDELLIYILLSANLFGKVFKLKTSNNII